MTDVLAARGTPLGRRLRPVAERPAAPIVALAGLMLLAAVALLWIARGFGFRYDEWTFISYFRPWTTTVFLKPYAGHFMPLEIGVFKALFSTIGITAYWPYRLVVVVVHLACAAIVYALARRRVGAWAALAIAACFLFLGSAYDTLLFPAEIGFVASTAAALAALLCLDRRDLRGDAAACVLLVVSTGFWEIGLAVAFGVLLELLLRQTRPRRLWVPLVPVVLYGLWYLRYGTSALVGGGSIRVNVTAVPAYVVDSAAGAVGGVVGLDLSWGRILLALLAVAAIRYGRSSPRLVALVAASACYWTLGGLSRAQFHDPAASRYLYFGGAVVLLVVAELARGITLRGRAPLALAAVAALAVVANVDALRNGERIVRAWNEPVRAQLAALELAGPSTPTDFLANPQKAPGLPAGQYFAAASELGSPADTAAELMREPERLREAADATFVGALGIRAQAAPPAAPRGRAPGIVRVGGGTPRVAGACVAIAGALDGAGVELAPRQGGVVIEAPSRSPATVSIRRFARAYAEPPLAVIPPGEARLFVLPARRAPAAWRMRVRASSGGVRACGVGAA